MGWERPAEQEAAKRDGGRERRVAIAIALSLAAHAVLLVVLLVFVRPPELPPAAPPVVEVTLLDHDVVANPKVSPTPPIAGAREGTTPAVRATPPAATVVVAPRETPTPAARSRPAAGGGEGGNGAPAAASAQGEGGYVVVSPGLSGIIDEHFRREREKAGQDASVSGPRDPRARRPGATATDQLDGIADLGSGEPGDPRIPGAGPVDIGQVLSRDATVAIAQQRAAEGVVHPFLCDVKERIEQEWDPKPADIAALSNPEKIFDPVCAAGYHKRFKVARILAVYDAAGTRIRFSIVGAPMGRNLEKRVEKAVDDAGMHPPPKELLDVEGHLRLAWNVFLDDYSGCNLVGTDSRGKRAYGMSYTVGVVELEGVF